MVSATTDCRSRRGLIIRDSTPRMSSSEPDHDDGPPRVTFFPPLQEQRQAWILSILRRERVVSVLDIGCGQGGLLYALAQPAFSLGYSDPLEIHMSKIAGVDVCESDLRNAENFIVGMEDRWPRWENLDVKLWKGGLEHYSPELVGYDCIVATEVCVLFLDHSEIIPTNRNSSIEHLHEPTLEAFPEIILGKYRPRLLLLTTPSYTFNARFTRPESTYSGFPDPTGRTDRVFRHNDHKFEWTPDEFKQWCEGVADAHKDCYLLDHISGIGKAQQADPWGRDEACGFATQVAIFRRRDDVALSPPLSTEVSVLHVLLASRNFTHNDASEHPLSSQEIRTTVANFMQEELRRADTTLHELWVEQCISQASGGTVDTLLAALEDDPMACKVESSQRIYDTKVVMLNFVAPATLAIEEVSEVENLSANNYGHEHGSFGEQLSEHTDSPTSARSQGWNWSEAASGESWTTVVLEDGGWGSEPSWGAAGLDSGSWDTANETYGWGSGNS